MSIEILKSEIEKISLTKDQKKTVNNHYTIVKNLLNTLGCSNIEKQGSFGRGTVIKGQAGEGFDLDIAVVVSNKNPNQAKELNSKIYNELSNIYRGENQKITIGKKAIQVDIKSNFGIDVTQIYKNLNEELVFNSFTNIFEPSYALKFKNLFRQKNDESENNSLIDLSRIYKHIRDSINDLEMKSLALEILLYNSIDLNPYITYEQTLINTLKNVQVILKDKLSKKTYMEINNPAYRSDIIDTGIKSVNEWEKICILNTLVIKVIEGALVHNKEFHSLKRKFDTLENINNTYNDFTVIPKSESVISGGTFGGNNLDNY